MIPARNSPCDLFLYRIRRELGSLAAALGGLDALVFTAGIGENSAAVRERICRDAAWLGLELDSAANEKRRSAHQRSGQQGKRLGHSDQRGTDDCATYAAPGRAHRRSRQRRVTLQRSEVTWPGPQDSRRNCSLPDLAQIRPSRTAHSIAGPTQGTLLAAMAEKHVGFLVVLEGEKLAG